MDMVVLAHIKEQSRLSLGGYGRPRMTEELKEVGVDVGLRSVTLGSKAGEIHGILGENGAGKSTMMKLLSGVIRLTGGSVAVDGKAVALQGPRDASQRGIVCIFQELSLMPALSVGDNIVLAWPQTRLGLMLRAAYTQARACLDRIGATQITLDRAVSELTLAGIVFSVIMRRTRWGLEAQGVGSSEHSAALTGVSLIRVRIIAHALGGLCAALCGYYLAMVTLTGDAGVGPTYTLNSIAAIVLGGVSLAGGVGKAWGVVIGALLLKTVAAVMFFSGLPPLAQPFFEGFVLAAAVVLGSLGLVRVRNRLKHFSQ
jgi:branched-subunit amino acid ABC-type transport system permease component